MIDWIVENIVLCIFIFMLVDGFFMYFLYIRFWKQKSISQEKKQQFIGMLQSIKSYTDDSMKIMELDKILDAILSEQGYKGTLGEKLKSKPIIIKNINDVWFAHKIRNKIAHEAGYELLEKDGKKALRILEENIHTLLQI